ncbi:hypothetical protein DAEQUDRAFT_641045, partial [Daedalea quercina L-15889]
IEALKFAIDWQARTAVGGGKKWKGDFFRRAFMCDPDYAAEFEGLTEQAAAQHLKGMDAVYKKWRNINGHTITARNRLLRLYHNV